MQEVNNLNGLGIAVVMAGSVLLLSLLLVATRSNAREGEKKEMHVEFHDDENDLDKYRDPNEDDVCYGGTT